MDWIVLSMVSALLLGCYDVTKKMAARQNAVPAVLLLSVTVGGVIWLPLVVWSSLSAETIPLEILRVQPLAGSGHFLIAAKSLLVGSSWTFALFALKHLPLSIAAPIRSTSPFWTIAIAITALGERPTAAQWLGMFVVLSGFWMFSRVGSREGIHFVRDRWVACMVAATVLGAISSIYDKILLGRMAIPPGTLQAWFTIYLVPVMLPLAVRWYRRERTADPFEFRWVVIAISPLLLAADLVYFSAVANPVALISVISTVRRCSVIVAFAFGIRALREDNVRAKAVCIATILLGAALLSLSASSLPGRPGTP